MNASAMIDTSDRLATLEEVIERGRTSFIEVGRALLEIKEDERYRERGFATFEEYCKVRWDFRPTYSYYLMEAFTIVNALDGKTPPRTEGQVRSLARLLDEPDKMREAWQLAQDQATFKDRPTGAEVRRAVAKILGHLPSAPSGKAELPWLKDRFDKLIYELEWWKEQAEQGTDHGYWDRIVAYINR